MNTTFLLMAVYGHPHIPIERVRTDYFGHMTSRVFRDAVQSGKIGLPIIRTDPNSQKTPLMVSVTDLASYLDARQHAARKELEGLAA